MPDRLHLAQVIRAWSAVGAAAAAAASLALQDGIVMPAQMVLFFFTYAFATQWRERIIGPC